jgi:hypothetical protein
MIWSRAPGAPAKLPKGRMMWFFGAVQIKPLAEQLRVRLGEALMEDH